MARSLESPASPPGEPPVWHRLSPEEAQARLARHGPNELEERGGRGPWQLLLGQFVSVIVLVLIAAAVVSALIGSLKDALVILVIVVLNAVLGFVQEYRAERAIAALRQAVTPVVRVRRGGQVQELPSRDLVPGDLVLLEAGNLVPADGRLIEAVTCGCRRPPSRASPRRWTRRRGRSRRRSCPSATGRTWPSWARRSRRGAAACS